MINDKSQGSVSARLTCGGLFIYRQTMYLSLSLVVKKIKIGKRLAKLQAKRLIALWTCSPCDFLLKDEELTYDRDKLFLLLLCYYTDYF